MGAAYARSSGVPKGDTYLASVQTMKWVLLYLSVGKHLAQHAWPHMPAALADHAVENLGSGCLEADVAEHVGLPITSNPC
jgi:hypothetical protein